MGVANKYLLLDKRWGGGDGQGEVSGVLPEDGELVLCEAEEYELEGEDVDEKGIEEIDFCVFMAVGL